MLHYLKPSAQFHLFILKRKAIFQLVLTFLLTVLFSNSAVSQNATKASGVLQSEADQAHIYYQNGEISKAVIHYQNSLNSIDFKTQTDLAWAAVDSYFLMCYAPSVPGFTLGVNQECNDSAFVFSQKLPLDSYRNIKRFLYFSSMLTVATQDRELLQKIFSDKALDHEEFLDDSQFYIRRQLLAAEAHLILKEYA